MENERSTTIPELVLDGEPIMPDLSQIDTPAASAANIEPLPKRDMAEGLTDEEKQVVQEFAKKIDISNSTQILQFGATAQRKMVSFSDSALSNVRGQDLSEVGAMITGLVVELKNFSPDEEKGGFKGFFRKQSNKLEAMKAKYDTIEKNVDKIAGELERHKMILLRDVTMLDKMYEMNLAYYKELTMYVLAGRQRLQEVEATELTEAKRKAAESGRPEDAQFANDLAAQCNRFDKKLYDLELTRNICIQMGPQIRLVQGNNTMMVEKIQSSIVNTIPLWKNQMVLSLGLAHSKDAIEAQRKVTNITNELLRKNADTLKVSTVEAAKESERGIVDIETLKYSNESLIATLDEVLRIQQDGYEKRRQAEGELQRIENELKSKLLEIRDTSQPGAPPPAV